MFNFGNRKLNTFFRKILSILLCIVSVASGPALAAQDVYADDEGVMQEAQPLMQAGSETTERLEYVWQRIDSIQEMRDFEKKYQALSKEQTSNYRNDIYGDRIPVLFFYGDKDRYVLTGSNYDGDDILGNNSANYKNKGMAFDYNGVQDTFTTIGDVDCWWMKFYGDDKDNGNRPSYEVWDGNENIFTLCRTWYRDYYWSKNPGGAFDSHRYAILYEESNNTFELFYNISGWSDIAWSFDGRRMKNTYDEHESKNCFKIFVGIPQITQVYENDFTIEAGTVAVWKDRVCACDVNIEGTLIITGKVINNGRFLISRTGTLILDEGASLETEYTVLDSISRTADKGSAKYASTTGSIYNEGRLIANKGSTIMTCVNTASFTNVGGAVAYIDGNFFFGGDSYLKADSYLEVGPDGRLFFGMYPADGDKLNALRDRNKTGFPMTYLEWGVTCLTVGSGTAVHFPEYNIRGAEPKYTLVWYSEQVQMLYYGYSYFKQVGDNAYETVSGPDQLPLPDELLEWTNVTYDALKMAHYCCSAWQLPQIMIW